MSLIHIYYLPCASPLYTLVARLHDIHGNDWVQIGHQLDRSGQSVRDKFRSLPIGGSVGKALLLRRH